MLGFLRKGRTAAAPGGAAAGSTQSLKACRLSRAASYTAVGGRGGGMSLELYRTISDEHTSRARLALVESRHRESLRAYCDLSLSNRAERRGGGGGRATPPPPPPQPAHSLQTVVLDPAAAGGARIEPAASTRRAVAAQPSEAYRSLVRLGTLRQRKDLLGQRRRRAAAAAPPPPSCRPAKASYSRDLLSLREDVVPGPGSAYAEALRAAVGVAAPRHASAGLRAFEHAARCGGGGSDTAAHRRPQTLREFLSTPANRGGVSLAAAPGCSDDESAEPAECCPHKYYEQLFAARLAKERAGQRGAVEAAERGDEGRAAVEEAEAAARAVLVGERRRRTRFLVHAGGGGGGVWRPRHALEAAEEEGRRAVACAVARDAARLGAAAAEAAAAARRARDGVLRRAAVAQALGATEAAGREGVAEQEHVEREGLALRLHAAGRGVGCVYAATTTGLRREGASAALLEWLRRGLRGCGEDEAAGRAAVEREEGAAREGLRRGRVSVVGVHAARMLAEVVLRQHEGRAFVQRTEKGVRARVEGRVAATLAALKR